MFPFVLTKWILLSTICAADGPPLSPERETCCMLSICRAFEFLPLYKRIFRFVPAISLDCTVSRIQPGFLPTCERRAFTPTRKWLCHFCRQRTKFAAFTLSFPQDKTKRDFPFFRKVSFYYPCADAQSKSANPPTSNLLSVFSYPLVLSEGNPVDFRSDV